MEIFKDQNLTEFTECFKTNQNCREHHSNIKWAEGYICRKCKHPKSKIPKYMTKIQKLVYYFDSEYLTIH